MRALVLTLLVLAACGDNVKLRDDGGATGSDAPPATAIGPCLDRPTNAVVQPGGGLPCELISPAYKAVP